MVDTAVRAPAAWEPDETISHCNACQVEFSFFVRRVRLFFSKKKKLFLNLSPTFQHHCRRDGKIYCGDCSSNSIPLPKFGLQNPVRVCDRCFDEASRENKFVTLYQPFLTEGGILVRYALRDDPSPIVVKLSSDTRRLTWHATQLIRNQPQSFDSISLDNVTEVYIGAQSETFQSFQNLSHKKEQCFSITAKKPGGFISLDLEAASIEERDKWVSAIKGAVDYFQGEKSSFAKGKASDITSDKREQEQREKERLREIERKKRTEEIRQKYGIGQNKE
jgi:hypothetical protein